MSLPFQSVAILGAGLMGRLLAVTLARAGCKVELFEAGRPEAEGAAARVRRGRHARARWPSRPWPRCLSCAWASTR